MQHKVFELDSLEVFECAYDYVVVQYYVKTSHGCLHHRERTGGVIVWRDGMHSYHSEASARMSMRWDFAFSQAASLRSLASAKSYGEVTCRLHVL